MAHGCGRDLRVRARRRKHQQQQQLISTRMAITSSGERSSKRGSSSNSITRIDPLDAIGSTRRCRRGRICCDRRTATCQHVAAVVGSRPGLDPRIQDVVLLAPNFTTNPYDPLFFSGKLG